MTASPSRLLIIEDNPQMCEMLASGLRNERIEIETVTEGSEALAWLRQQKFDLVLLDLGLPNIDGTEVLRRMKEDHGSEHIPVIVLTGRQGTSEKVRAFELGAADYLVKPFALVELRARVDSALRTKHLQDELSAANQQLAAKAEFLAKTSHEIRTQLGAVTAMASILSETELTPQQRDYLQTIRTSGESLLTLLNDILNVSKIEAGKLELEQRPFHLRLCMDEALDLLAAKAAEKNIELLCEIGPGIPEEVIGDANRLRQVLVNLLSNAVKFTQVGEVHLGVDASPANEECQAQDASEIAGSGLQAWEYHISVRDTGTGIPADRLCRLFKSFSQTDSAISREFGGTGLGLFIAKGLVELMGGRLWAESVEGQGSTFHIVVRLLTAPSQSAVAAWQGPQPHLSGRRVLIANDNPTCASFLARTVAQWGMRPVQVSGGVEALGSLRNGTRFDLAIIDFCLHDTDGAQLARQIRQDPSLRRLPLAFLVPLGKQAAAAELNAASWTGVINKPVKPGLLHSTLLRVLTTDARETPAPHPAPSPAPVSKLDGTLASRVPLRILLTDDNVINQKVGGRMLSQFGYHPVIVNSGAEALAALERDRFDLVFMDVQMPGMDGLEATRRIRAFEAQSGRSPAVIVAMTANAMAGDREKCLASGMNDYLSKPVMPEALQKVLEKQRRLDPPPVSAPAEQAPPPAPNGLAGVDMSRLLDFAGGSRESLAEIVGLYIQQTSEQVAQMRSCLATGDFAALGRLAHTCAGASGICGVTSVAGVVRELEHACRDGRTNSAPGLLDRVCGEFQKAQDFLAGQLQVGA